MRFDWRLGVAATVAALTQDVLLVLGAFAWLGKTYDGLFPGRVASRDRCSSGYANFARIVGAAVLQNRGAVRVRRAAGSR
ncbi:hypothetical protein [Haloechinothrix salitolerans]|uniref:Uncharacterized protein n=1 Tax=Haloechinothrix salitolerans TaxID=926830 RepID=A0ABW2BU70_9PSEU